MDANQLKASNLYCKVFKTTPDDILSIKTINLGFTNQSFCLENKKNQKYQVRIGNTQINRNNEKLILQALQDQGGFVYYDDQTGDAIKKWVEGKNPSIQEACSDVFLKAFATQMHKLHELEANNKISRRDFFIFETISDFKGLENQLNRYKAIINKYASLPLVICHNDLRPENLIWDGKQVVIIDYEWGTLNHRYWDLGNFLRELEYPIDQLEAMLQKHFEWANFSIVLEFLFACTFFAYQWTFFPEPTPSVLDYRKNTKRLMSQYFELLNK